MDRTKIFIQPCSINTYNSLARISNIKFLKAKVSDRYATIVETLGYRNFEDLLEDISDYEIKREINYIQVPGVERRDEAVTRLRVLGKDSFQIISELVKVKKRLMIEYGRDTEGFRNNTLDFILNSSGDVVCFRTYLGDANNSPFKPTIWAPNITGHIYAVGLKDIVIYGKKLATA